jgi:drug/metabolite transporter (DMT)-like permease
MTLNSPVFYEIIGYSAALGSAMAWAIGSILFRRVGEASSPTGMNLVKCLIGSIYLGLALLVAGGVEPISGQTYLILAFSGLLGIALGDTFFFKALVNLGPRLTVLLGTLGPVLTIVFAVALLGEKLSYFDLLGGILTLTGVNIVLWEDIPSDLMIKRKWTSGVGYALLAAICMSLGIITAKVAVDSTSAMHATFARVVFAGMGLSLWGLGSRQLGGWVLPFKDPILLKAIMVAVFVVIFGGFWLSLVALKYIDASIATILNSTEPIFVLPLVGLFLKEKVTARAIGGAVVAVAGVALILGT